MPARLVHRPGFGWLLHSTRLTRPELRIFYDLHGCNDATEAELYHLEGYRRSRPVRVGNAAGNQLQLDTCGSVILAAYDHIERMGTLSGGELQVLSDFGKVVCGRWREPDQACGRCAAGRACARRCFGCATRYGVTAFTAATPRASTANPRARELSASVPPGRPI